MTCGGERVFVCRQLPATTIPHQAAPEENGRGSLSLELPFGLRYYAVPCGLKNHGMSQLGIGVGVCLAAQLHVTINSALGPRYEEFRPRTICSRQPSRNATRFRNSGRRRSWESSWRLGSRRRFKEMAVLAALPILYHLLLPFCPAGVAHRPRSPDPQMSLYGHSPDGDNPLLRKPAVSRFRQSSSRFELRSMPGHRLLSIREAKNTLGRRGCAPSEGDTHRKYPHSMGPLS